MTKILLIEDDATINELIQEFLQDKGCCCTPAYSGTEGRLLVDMEKFELILLDLMIPGMSGQDLLEYIRAGLQTPVIVLSARTALEDKVELLGMGADDYLTKPFSINELMARVNSLIRRYTLLNPIPSTETDCTVFQGMTIDNLNRLVFMNDVQVELTGKEFDLLSFLAANKGKVFTKKQIYTHVWEEEYAFDDSNIMSFISKLRKKIEPDPEHPFYILTVRGVGYRFNREA